MWHHYKDIIGRAGRPVWWDEHAVPRYCEFSPDACANIYAKQVALVRIRCQDCGAIFDVAFSFALWDQVRHGVPSLKELIERRAIHFGDPPNAGCCPAGPTMNSIPMRVLQFWQKQDLEMQRIPALEIDLDEGWNRPAG